MPWRQQCLSMANKSGGEAGVLAASLENTRGGILQMQTEV